MNEILSDEEIGSIKADLAYPVTFYTLAYTDMQKALNTIESLKADNARLREALETVWEYLGSPRTSEELEIKVVATIKQALSTSLDKTEEKQEFPKGISRR